MYAGRAGDVVARRPFGLDVNIDYERQLAETCRSMAISDLRLRLAEVRQLAGIRKLENLSKPDVERLDTVERPGCRIQKLLLKPEDEIVLPALYFVPAKEPHLDRGALRP